MKKKWANKGNGFEGGGRGIQWRTNDKDDDKGVSSVGKIPGV